MTKKLLGRKILNVQLLEGEKWRVEVGGWSGRFFILSYQDKRIFLSFKAPSINYVAILTHPSLQQTPPPKDNPL